jgi:glutaredoxin
MRTLLLPLAMLILAGPLEAAQLYRWVDDKGNVEWRDTPPPSSAKKVEQRKIGTSTIETSELPYSLQLAVKNHPVTLWITDCGEVCARVRSHLSRRGVPHTERNPQAEMEAFRKASGGGLELPLLQVGSRQLKGYLERDWDAALDEAGYPRTAIVAVKPQKPVVASKDAKDTATANPAVKLYTNAQCDTQCAVARELLAARGVKFQEVTANDPSAIEEVKKTGVNATIPVLVVGRFVVPGFDPASYHKVLDSSGFQRPSQ